jgi:hypothetical protein
MTAPAIPAPAGKGRLGNGQLRRQVAEWLAARPGPHTVGEIAKDLGRSAGAVGNALTTLADRAEASRLDGALGLAQPGATRILVIVSDGRYKGTQHADGQKLVTRLVASGCLVIWIAPATPRAPWLACGWSSSMTPPPPVRRSLARSPPAPAPPDPAPGGGPTRLRGAGGPRRGMATRAPGRGTGINAAGKEKAAGAEKTRCPGPKAGIRSGCFPGNRRPSHWRESSCQVRIVSRRISVLRRAEWKTASGIVAELLDFTSRPEQLSSRKHRRRQNGNRNSAGE